MNCDRCGIEIPEILVYKRIMRGTYDGQCLDCKMPPTRELKYNKERCRPWNGEVDENFQPLDQKGRLYLPGIRTCNHKDCVNKSHIIPDIEAERVDISYRTGQKLNWKSLVKEAM